jgi:hypothetical protein
MAEIKLISKAGFPIPIRTDKLETISRTRITRSRDGSTGTRPENFRSRKTVILLSGRGNAITCPDTWKNLSDVKAYRKRGWLLVYDVVESVAKKSNRSDDTKSKKARS